MKSGKLTILHNCWSPYYIQNLKTTFNRKSGVNFKQCTDKITEKNDIQLKKNLAYQKKSSLRKRKNDDIS